MTQTSVTSTAARPLTMTDLYNRLAKLGFSKKYLQEIILPDWWTDEVDQTPGVLMEGALYLSRRLNIDIDSLLTRDIPQFIPSTTPKFKTQTTTDLQKAIIPCAIALRIARMVACDCPTVFNKESLTAVSDIRQHILEKASVIDLSSVLDFCWESGIPVIHLNQFPTGVHRFQGMVAHVDDRPTIIVSLKDLSPARLLFVIAHELGHILANHLDENGCRVDTEIQLESDEAEETEANELAAELLLGQPGISYDIWQKYLSTEQLVHHARLYGDVSHTDPAVIALNIAWNRAQRASSKKAEGIAWATGKKAIALLEPHSNAPTQINQKLAEQLDLFCRSDSLNGNDQKNYLKRMLALCA